MTSLLHALQSEEAQLKEVLTQNLRWYYDILSKTKAGNGEVSVSCDGHVIRNVICVGRRRGFGAR